MAAKKTVKDEPTLIASPKDPNVCFVLFSSTYLTASSAAVSLRSLCLQLEREDRDRVIESIQYDSAARRLEIKFEPKGEGKR
ncbi:hypothetical protein PMI08_05244 [Brevibacillus sp. CF112]|uniref:hypothetical protein n=1 Tax=Brevibacillus TaxID=55080 RepID=UPI000271A2B2|nr:MULTISPECIES: hypothetical protein [Brevibacillus]EJL38960.1 hypothetical protein PMI08_05244 [Brevibacillus sp. CF112]MBY0054773.1 hypothetical protein [Brevibacillus agri]